MTEEVEGKKLSAKENAFVEAWLHGPSRFDATKAARAAGYKDNENLHTNANKLLQKTTIRAEIDRRLEEIKLTKAAVFVGLADIANGDVADFMDVSSMGWNISLLLHDENGDLIIDEQTGKPIKNPKTKLIKRLKQKVTTISKKDEEREIIETELELYSAHDALRDMGKHYDLFTDHVDVTSKGEKLEIVVKYADNKPNLT